MPLDTLDQYTTVVTVNRRLSRVLRAAFDRSRLADGATVWESPDIIPYSTWLERCWTDFAATAEGAVPALLGAEQDFALWEQVVGADPLAEGEVPLLRSAEMARNAQAAWALLRNWGLDHERLPGFSSAEVRAFRAWARAYAARCRRDHWVDLASVGERLVREGLAAVSATGIRRVLLAGFDTLTPQQQSLFTALGEHGVRVERWQPPAHEPHPRRLAFADQDDELEAAARWARRCVEEGARGPLGIVVPGLSAARHRVAAIFEDVFAPGDMRPGTTRCGQTFNISLGEPLAEVPVVSDALVCLRAMSGRMSLRDAGRWLLSPYLGGGRATWRARLDAQLRRIGEPYYGLVRLRDLAARIDGAGSPQPGAELTDRLERLHARVPSAQRRFALTDWAAQFSSWLVAAGWPGERTLSSEEFQAVQAYREQLASLGALAPVMPAVDYAQALSQLQGLAARQVFQPRSDAVAVQILGVLEAVGVDFSHLWLSGLHHEAWPEPARPNPFLPVQLQRELGMPRAGPEQQLDWARRWTERMLASAEHVVVSHPLTRGDEPLRASALIAGLPPAEAAAIAASPVPLDRLQVHAHAPTLEALEDAFAPAVESRGLVRGGVSVFKDQAACPFRAFAVHRLGAADVAAPDSSLDPRVRGNLIHRLLELIWQALGGQSRLLAITGEARADLIRASVARVLGDEARQRPHTLRGRLLAVEQQRLEALADAWLAIEAARAPFEVEAEHSRSASIAGLPMTIRPDRVDRLAGGELLLIDYKTGRCDPKDWFGERPDEPQLPVYAVAIDDVGNATVAGLAFGVLRPGELGYRGLGGIADLAPGVDAIASSKLHGVRDAPNWDAHKALWRSRLAGLAQAHLQGDARVDPKTRGVTCRHCGLQPLCRINEQ